MQIHNIYGFDLGESIRMYSDLLRIFNSHVPFEKVKPLNDDFKRIKATFEALMQERDAREDLL